MSQALLQRADIPIPTITAALERDLAMASDCDSDDDAGDCESPHALSRNGSMSLSPPGACSLGHESPGPRMSRSNSTGLPGAEAAQECSRPESVCEVRSNPCSPLPQVASASSSPARQQQQQQEGAVVGYSEEPASGDSPEMSDNGAGDDEGEADVHVGSALASFDMAGLIAQLTLSKEEGLIDDKLIRDLQIIQSLIGALKTPAAGTAQPSTSQQQHSPAATTASSMPAQQQQQQQQQQHQQPNVSPVAMHLSHQHQQAMLNAQLQHQQMQQQMQMQQQIQQQQQLQQMQQMHLAASLTASPLPNMPLPGMYGALSPAGMMGPVHPSMHPGMHAGLPGMMSPAGGMPVNAMRRPDPRVRRTFSFAAGC